MWEAASPVRDRPQRGWRQGGATGRTPPALTHAWGPGPGPRTSRLRVLPTSCREHQPNRVLSGQLCSGKEGGRGLGAWGPRGDGQEGVWKGRRAVSELRGVGGDGAPLTEPQLRGGLSWPPGHPSSPPPPHQPKTSLHFRGPSRDKDRCPEGPPRPYMREWQSSEMKTQMRVHPPGHSEGGTQTASAKGSPLNLSQGSFSEPVTLIRAAGTEAHRGPAERGLGSSPRSPEDTGMLGSWNLAERPSFPPVDP